MTFIQLDHLTVNFIEPPTAAAKRIITITRTICGRCGKRIRVVEYGRKDLLLWDHDHYLPNHPHFPDNHCRYPGHACGEKCPLHAFARVGDPCTLQELGQAVIESLQKLSPAERAEVRDAIRLSMKGIEP